MEEATLGLRQARESLLRAEQELFEWKTANKPLVTTHPTYVELKAEVIRCTQREDRARQTFKAALAAKRGKMSV